MIKRISLVLLGCFMLAACSESADTQTSTSSAAQTTTSQAEAPSSGSFTASQAPEGGYRDGLDYQTLARPVNTEDASKIEVTEVFWYGCIHCFRLEPMLEDWVASLPEDVNFNHVPAIWHPTMEVHARIYYASRALGVLEQTHWATFQQLNRNANSLSTEDDILDFMEDLGIDREQYRRAFNSFGVNSQITQAQSKAQAYGIRGTPEIIVEGRYRISTEMTGTQQKMLDVAAWLVEQNRQVRNAGA